MARDIRVYHEQALQSNTEVVLSESASHHLLTVLRVSLGSEVVVFDGRGGEYAATVKSFEKKRVCLQVKQYDAITRESTLHIELVQGISRGERMEYAIQKSVELGVAAITPVFTERCGVKLDHERLSRRVAQWQAILIGAAEQSGRTCLPRLNTPMTLEQWLAAPATSTRLVCAPGASSSAWSPLNGRVSLVVGPEGGFSPHEMRAILQAECQPLSLGPRILRTETAAVVALALVQAKAGDL